MRGIIIARVSTREQEERGLSIPAQVDRLVSYAKNLNLEDVEVHEITESSTKGTRKRLQEILKIIKRSRQPVALILDTVDRLQRSFKESVILDDLRKAEKVELHFLREGLVINRDSNSADLLRWDMAVMFARSYVLQLSDNVKRSNAKKIGRGEWIGQAPTGYRHVTKEDGTKDIAIDHEQAPLVHACFRYFSKGAYSIRSLTDEMEKLGLRSRSGRRLSPSNIHRLLSNPFYKGEMTYKGETFPHKYERIVSNTLWEECQQLLTQRNRNPNKKWRTKDFTFRGVLRCAQCGCTITAESQKGGRLVYYSCTNAKKICKKIYVREEVLEEAISKELRKLVLSPQDARKVLELLEEDDLAQVNQQSKKNLEHALEGAQRRLGRLIDDYYDERISEEIYLSKKVQYEQAIKQAKEDLIRIQESEQDKARIVTHAEKVIKFGQRALEVFQRSEVPEKNEILTRLLQNATLDGKIPVFAMAKPFDTIALHWDRPCWGELQYAFRTIPAIQASMDLLAN